MNLLTTKEVAERLGVSVTRVQFFIKSGRLLAQKLGRDYVINEDDLAQLGERRVGRPRKRTTEGVPAPGITSPSPVNMKGDKAA